MVEDEVIKLRARVAKLERQVAFFERHLGVKFVDEGPTGVSQEVSELVHQGDKIAAIKLYRQQTGASLREAKDVIDSM